MQKKLDSTKYHSLFIHIFRENILGFLKTHAIKKCHYLRVVLVLLLLSALLSLFNGCSSQIFPTQEPGLSDYKETGLASYYGRKFQYRTTASGETFNYKLMTAAHKSLPFGTQVEVKNLTNGKTVKVTINDRGPFISKRIIDLSRAAFSKIEDIRIGIAKVEIRVVH